MDKFVIRKRASQESLSTSSGILHDSDTVLQLPPTKQANTSTSTSTESQEAQL